jgi:hypothetical protein
MAAAIYVSIKCLQLRMTASAEQRDPDPIDVHFLHLQFDLANLGPML